MINNIIPSDNTISIRTIVIVLNETLVVLSAKPATKGCIIIDSTEARESVIPTCVLSKPLDLRYTFANPKTKH